MPSDNLKVKLEKYYENYKGEFQKDRFEGEGVYQFADGAVYEGGWQKGIKKGKGKLTLTSKKRSYFRWDSVGGRV
jgi:hypothetical protein